MEVLLNLQNKNVTLNAVHVAPEGTNCCNRLKVHFDVFQETAKKAAIIRLSTANSFELIHYQDKHIALLIPFIIRKSKFPQNPKRSVRFSGKRTKRSVQKRKARNTQKAETKVL